MNLIFWLAGSKVNKAYAPIKTHLALSVLLLISPLSLLAQNLKPVAQKVADTKTNQGNNSSIVKPFSLREIDKERRNSKEELEYFELDKTVVENLIANHQEYTALEIPRSTGTNLILDIIDVSKDVAGFNIITSDGRNLGRRVVNEVHYRGIVRGKEGPSLVALSLFENEISGFISIDGEHDYVLKKGNSTDTHILSTEAVNNSSTPSGEACSTVITNSKPYPNNILFNNQRTDGNPNASNKYVKIFIETEYELYVATGSAANTATYVATLFNQTAALYANEGIRIILNELKIWTTADPYLNDNTANTYYDYRSKVTSINGDLGVLLIPRNSGGIAVIGGLCKATVNNSVCAVGLRATQSPFVVSPIPPETVKALAHELGHLLNSDHTHACVWNGNGTAIDNCATAYYNLATSCPGAPTPTDGGTIMSYCHLAPGYPVNLSNGFGLQPGNVMRAYVASSACLATCSPNLNITTNVATGTKDLQVATNITASNTINANAFVTYIANSVTLQPGFIASDTDFLTYGDDICASSSPRISETNNDNTVTSVSDEKSIGKNIDLVVFPNPTDNRLTIQYSFIENINYTVRLYNTSGTEVLAKEVSERNNNIYLLELNQGLYLLELISPNSRNCTKVLIQK